MRVKGKKGAKFDAKAELDKVTWFDKIANKEEVVPLINFATGYPKGTTTQPVTIRIESWMVHQLEVLAMHSDGTFMSPTEALRSIINVGFVAHWSAIMKNKERTLCHDELYIFYKSFGVATRMLMKVAGVVEKFRSVYSILSKQVRNGNLKKEVVAEKLQKEIDQLPDNIRDEVIMMIEDEYSIGKAGRDKNIIPFFAGKDGEPLINGAINKDHYTDGC